MCCTDYKIDGQFIQNVQNDFGKYTKQAFKAAQSSIQDIKLSPDLNLNADLTTKLKAFANELNTYKSTLDLENKPKDIYYYSASVAIYELTESFLKTDANSAEKLSFLEANQNTSYALFDISKKGVLNVSTTLIPFVNDARDFYELINGKDLITNEEIDGFGRIVTAVALVAGNGNIYRKAAEKLKDSFLRKQSLNLYQEYLNLLIPGVVAGYRKQELLIGEAQISMRIT